MAAPARPKMTFELPKLGKGPGKYDLPDLLKRLEDYLRIHQLWARVELAAAHVYAGDNAAALARDREARYVIMESIGQEKQRVLPQGLQYAAELWRHLTEVQRCYSLCGNAWYMHCCLHVPACCVCVLRYTHKCFTAWYLQCGWCGVRVILVSLVYVVRPMHLRVELAHVCLTSLGSHKLDHVWVGVQRCTSSPLILHGIHSNTTELCAWV